MAADNLQNSANPLPIAREIREREAGHFAAVLWFTGLSGVGKSTIAQSLEATLVARKCRTIWLDGDLLRSGLNRDLGFSLADRTENIRRAAEIAKLAFDQGNIVICTFISPIAKDRAHARSLIPNGRFIEVYMTCSLEERRHRDPKGLYAKAYSGAIQQFSGISSPYEPPDSPEVQLDSSENSIPTLVENLLNLLRIRRIIV